MFNYEDDGGGDDDDDDDDDNDDDDDDDDDDDEDDDDGITGKVDGDDICINDVIAIIIYLFIYVVVSGIGISDVLVSGIHNLHSSPTGHAASC